MKKSTLNYSKKQVFEAAEDALEELEIEIEDSSLKAGIIKAHYGGNMLSFGNNIEVSIKTTSTKKTTIEIESTTWAQLQIVDWGTNDKLEEKIISGIKYFLNP